MVPFYGQGMNAGLEDVRVLFSILDKHTNTKDGLIAQQSGVERELALKEYSETRVRDAHAINDLALDNYKEMRSSVTDPVYKFRKWLEVCSPHHNTRLVTSLIPQLSDFISGTAECLRA